MSKIVINREALEEEEIPSEIRTEIRGRSITPTSFSSRIYEEGFGSPIFVEDYSHSEHHVRRFGINKYSSAVQTQIDSTSLFSPASATPTPVSGGGGGGGGGASSSPATEVSSSVATSRTARTIAEFMKNVVHIDTEVELLHRAVNHLLEEDARKTVLLDILERDIKTGEISGITHTILLYKNPGAQSFAVIDPSNFQFSCHLNNDDITTKISSRGTDAKIITFSKDINIYKVPKGRDIGPGAAEWRDCVDIAVKLAFGYNATEEWDAITKKNDITSSDVVQRISNQAKLYRDFFHIPDYAIRIRQASEIEISKKFFEVGKAFYSILFEGWRVMGLPEREKLVERYKEVCNKDSAEHKSTLIDLCDSYRSLSNEMAESVRASSENFINEILGDITIGEGGES